MNFKKRVNGSWTDTPHYIHNTSTDTITTPADIYANDNNATVGLKGNMEQSGTPTPTSPIQPQECGERTENLSPVSEFDKPTTYLTQYYPITLNEPLAAGTYTLSAEILAELGVTEARISFRKEDETQEKAVTITIAESGRSSVTITLSNSAYYIYFYGTPNAADVAAISYRNLMINTGSTPLPYEPYGIKIPILSNSQTTNVYLGEVETTRKINKLVLTGQEGWNNNSSGNTRFFFTTVSNETILNSEIICTHFENVDIGQSTTDVGICFAGTAQLRVRPENVSGMTADAFKTWLQQQYTNGTPVCVWYVLASPTTGIVNEPIRKMGDYADTLSNVSIPVTTGGDTLSISTTVQPSEVTVNYKGWHPVQSVHERENGTWT